MRDHRRTGRLSLALAAAALAGLLTAWAEPTSRPMAEMKREIAALVDTARSDVGPVLTVVDQALPVARTIVSKSQ